MALREAPTLCSHWATSRWPLKQALCSGVFPWMSVACKLTQAPTLSSHWAMLR